MATNTSFKKETKFISGKVQKNKFHKNPVKKFNPQKQKVYKLIGSLKRNGKKGNYGHGSTIEQEHFLYFLKIFEAIQKPALFSADRVSMATNALEETKGQEIHLASNQIVSWVLEAIIGFGSEEHVERFLDVFGEDFRKISSDRYASHVLQKLVEVAFLRAVEGSRISNEEEKISKKFKIGNVTDSEYNMETKFSKNHKTKCAAFVERISKFVLNNLEDFVSDNFANHLIRICVKSLAGLYVPKYYSSKQLKHNFWSVGKITYFTTPEGWNEILLEFPSRLEMWPQLSEMVYNVLKAPLLGAVCIALGAAKMEAELTRFGKKLIKDAFFNDEAAKTGNIHKKTIDAEKKRDENKESGTEEDDGENESDTDSDKKENESVNGSEEDENGLPAVFLNDSSERLLEDILGAAAPKLYNEIYKNLFEGRITALVMDKRGYYAVKTLLDHMTDKNLYETIFDELASNFEKFLDIGNRAIFHTVSEACLRLNTKQAAFLTAVQNVLHCTAAHGEDRPNSFLTCLVKFKRFEDVEDSENEYASKVGSLITQNILQFNKPIFLVNCILETYPKDIFKVVRSLHGSYVGDAFVKSKTIGEKSREKFVKLFDGYYMELALSSSGSRLLENMFKVANDTQRLRIAKELTTRDNKLKSTLFGRIMYNKLRLETYKLSPEQWKASWKVEDINDALNGSVKKNKKAESTPEEQNEDAKNGSAKKTKKAESTPEEQNEDAKNGSAKKGKKRTASMSDEKNENTAKPTPKKGKKRTGSTSEKQDDDTLTVSTPEEQNEDAKNGSAKKGKKRTASMSDEKIENTAKPTPKKGKKRTESTSEKQDDDTLTVTPMNGKKSVEQTEVVLNQSVKKTPKKGNSKTESISKVTNGSATPNSAAKKKKKASTVAAPSSALKKNKKSI